MLSVLYCILHCLCQHREPVPDAGDTQQEENEGPRKKTKNNGALGVKLFKEGKYAEAVSEFGKYLETVPGISRNSLSSREPGHIPAGVLLVSLLD